MNKICEVCTSTNATMLFRKCPECIRYNLKAKNKHLESRIEKLRAALIELRYDQNYYMYNDECWSILDDAVNKDDETKRMTYETKKNIVPSLFL